MDPRLVFAVLGFTAIAITVAARILAQLTPWQIGAVAWALAMALGLAGLFQIGVLDGPLWSLTHLGQPRTQSEFIAREVAADCTKVQCSVDLDAVGWRATVRTAIGGPSGHGMFIILQAGPDLMLQNAPRFDAVDDPAFLVTQTGEQDKAVQSGEPVGFSGHIHALKARAGLPADSNTIYLQVDLTAIAPVDSPLLGAPILLVLAWMGLASPALAGLVWQRRRTDESTPLSKSSSSASVESFRLAGVGPGTPGMPITELVAECRACLAKERREDAIEVARRLEEARPANEAEWRLLCELFYLMKRHATEELICERFLLANPQNLEVSVYLARLLARMTLTRPRAMALARLLRHREGLTIEHRVHLGDVFLQGKEIHEATNLYRSSLSIDPRNVNAQSHLLEALVRTKSKIGARSALTRLREIAPQNPLWGVVTAEFSARLGDKKGTLACGLMAQSGIRVTDISFIRRLTQAYILSGLANQADSFLEDFDLTNISADTLTAIAEIAKKSALKCSLRYYKKLVELEPNNASFQIILLELDRHHHTFYRDRVMYN